MRTLRIRAVSFLPLIFVIFSLLAPAAHAATTFIVSTTTDNETGGDGNCTLREAILIANGTPANDDCGGDRGAPYTVRFLISDTITLASELPHIARSMTIDGEGYSVNVSGNNTVRVFYVNSGVTLNLNRLTMSNGNSGAGGGIYNDNGTVTISSSTISGSTATGFGGGGGIVNYGTLVVINSTISNNTATGNSGGGGVGNYGNMAVMTSTISGNTATGYAGGGVYNFIGSTATFANSTIASNSATSGSGGGLFNESNTVTITNSTIYNNYPNGIYNYAGPVTVKNSIIATGASGGSCCGPVTANGLNNLANDGTCGASFINSPSINLGTLGNNGGSTQTIPLLDGSAAVDTGDDAVCAAYPVNSLDQRGVPRPIGLHCDIGAFEKCTSSVTVSSSADDGPGSLRRAIVEVCSGGTINFGGNYVITLASQLNIDKSMTIDGSGHSVTVSGNNAVRVFYVNVGVTFNMNKLTVTNGKSDYGGGIRNNGTLNVTNSTISENSASIWGGGIISYNALYVTNSTISGNIASSFGGGGIDIESGGTTTVTNSTISGNSAINGIGGIGNWGGRLTVSNSIVAGNPSGGNCDGTITGSQNLADDGTCGSGFTNSSSINLAPLGNYGGSTRTFQLLPGSAAIDAGDDTACAASPVNNQDQRGIIRPKGSHCDIGALESQGFSLTATGGDHQTAIITTNFASPLEVNFTETGGAGLPGVSVNFVAPSSGASTFPAIFTATTGVNGVASAMAKANDTVGGPYSVVASAAGASTNFTLENVAALAKLIIAFAGGGSGTVTSTSPDYPVISCVKGVTGGCSNSFPLKTSVTVVASEDWKSLFDSWSGGLTSGLNPVTFIMDKDKTIITTFNPNYKVILLPGGTPFASIQDAYASVSTGIITIQAQVYAFPEELLFNNDSNVTLTGGMDSSYNPTSGYSSVNKLTVVKGQAVIRNIVIK
jgi:CSLREA domain-containing protein